MSFVLYKPLRRKVLIIKGAAQNDNENKYDSYYANAYKTYFKSTSGGAYIDDEIDIIVDVTLSSLNERISSLIEDFVIIVYIGHGANEQDYQLFKLNENEIIRPGELLPPTKKGIIILESCRCVLESIPIVTTGKIPSFKEGGKIILPLSNNNARSRYNLLLKQAKDGFAICFACSKDEEAINYYFSTHLLNISYLLSKKDSCNIGNIFNVLCEQFEKHDILQKPEIIGNIELPFSVHIYQN